MSFDVKNLVANVQQVYETTVSELEKSFQTKDNLTVKVLNTRVAAELNRDVKDVSLFVSHLLHNCGDYAHVVPGVGGGVRQGPRKVKEVKVVKNPRKKKTDSTEG